MSNESELNADEKSYEYNTSLYSLDVAYYDNNLYWIRPETVKKWLANPMVYNQQLRNLSRRLYNSNGIYTNVIDYTTALPTLDRVLTCNHSNHNRAKKNKQLFSDSLKKIKDKITTRDNLHKLGVDGTAFYYFETTQNSSFPQFLSDYEVDDITEINALDFNCSLLPLPTDYCKIIGRKNSSPVVAFDMAYFDQFLSNGLSLRLTRYPKEIRDAYKLFKKDSTKRWAVLDNNKTVTSKVRSRLEEKWGRPFGLAGFIDMLYDEYFLETKRNILDELNSTIIYETFPEGEKKGTSSLTKKQQEQQHNNIKSALFSRGSVKGTNFFSIAAGTKLDKLETNIEFLKSKGEDELIKRIATDLGFAGSSLNGQDGNFSSQKSNMDLVSAEIFSWLEQIQDELNKVINANIIQDKQAPVELYYLPITHANRKERVSEMKDLYTNGGGSLLAWVASTGFNPDAYVSLLEYEKAEKFDQKYTPHQTSFTISKNGAGRQENTNPTNPNTIKSKTNGSNLNPN